MPPAAACAGAACWAAKYKKYALLRSVFCRTACQHAAAKPINQRTAAWYAGAAAGMGVQAIRCGTFLYRGWNRTREIQKPLVFGGVLFHISFAVERNMAAGGIEKKVVGPLRPKVTRARGAEYPSPEAWGKRKATGRRGRRSLRGASIKLRRKMRTGCGAKKARSAIDRTRYAIGVGGGESRRCHSAGTK